MITEFNYRYSNAAAKNNKQAHIFVGVRLGNQTNERENLVSSLTEANYTVEDLTENELAKVQAIVSSKFFLPRVNTIFSYLVFSF